MCTAQQRPSNPLKFENSRQYLYYLQLLKRILPSIKGHTLQGVAAHRGKVTDTPTIFRTGGGFSEVATINKQY